MSALGIVVLVLELVASGQAAWGLEDAARQGRILQQSVASAVRLNKDTQGLLTFKDGISNAASVPQLASWTGESVCDWQGVSCLAWQRVVAVSLPNAGLKGSIAPNSLSQIEYLRDIDLSYNSLSGIIPEDWAAAGALAHLRQLNLTSNGLTRAPTNWGASGSQALQRILLGGNDLTELPGGWTFSNLSRLELQLNRIHGPIPGWSLNPSAIVTIMPQQPGTSPCGEVPSSPTFQSIDGSGSYLLAGSLGSCGNATDPTPPGAPDSSSAPIGAIVGGVVGGLTVTVIVVGAFWWWRRRKQGRQGGSLTKGQGGGKGARSGKEYPDSSSSLDSEGLDGPGGEDKGPSLSQDPLVSLLLSKLAEAPQGRQLSERSLAGGTLLPGRPPTPSGGSSNVSTMTANPSMAFDMKVWTIQFQSLELEREIGAGSFGRVFLAKWNETPVAVKLLLSVGLDLANVEAAADAMLSLSNPILAALQQEAGLMAVLRHPNIVSFMGVCSAPPCVVTEYCSRGSLTDVLRAAKASPAKGAQLDWLRRLNMALDAARGMLHLHVHEPPIMHRDLKGPNLLVDQHWRVKVCDFNLSKIMEESQIATSMAANNPRWLAPEILGGDGATFASDVFSFGVVLWELLCWEIPWRSSNTFQVVKAVLGGQRLPIPPTDQLPGPGSFPGLGDYLSLMQHCWAQKPEDRPSFAAVAARLREMLPAAASVKGTSRRSAASLTNPSQAVAAPDSTHALTEALGPATTNGSAEPTAPGSAHAIPEAVVPATTVASAEPLAPLSLGTSAGGAAAPPSGESGSHVE